MMLPARKLQVASAGKKPLKYFTVNEENGNLYVSERLDREELCGKSASCSVSFEALVHNPLNVFHVQVAIEDVNDNAPHFLQDKFHLEVNELTSPGARFHLGMAEDADVGSNSLQGYELETNGYFAVEAKEIHDGSKLAELVLRRPLNRESEQILRLMLTALDGGDPPRSGTAQLWINVTDANDNPPVFAQDRYRASLREDTPPGSRVLNVSASDADSGTNAHITYSFGKMPAKVLQKFVVNAETGTITLQEPLDFEDTSAFSLPVEARDGGGLVAHCEVEVEVLDVNDNTPEITILSLSSPVSEDAPVGTVVALLNVHDPDSGENGVALAVLARLRRAGPPAVLRCLGAQRFSLAGAAFPPDFCEGTLPYSYNLCVAAPARAAAEAAWPPPPLPILPAGDLLAGEPCDKPILSSSAVAGEPPRDPDALQIHGDLFVISEFKET
ncbi:protocadherin gamma-B5-like [Empidonax traillii]|uniref:protocadherin gamma-B5-like n=1 Tax=Empidonax traillii TaxID=164674 RepID=UPI000FFD2D37|nr:protocadherin gamma-B5-like [Empidonax traillii]